MIATTKPKIGPGEWDWQNQSLSLLAVTAAAAASGGRQFSRQFQSRLTADIVRIWAEMR